MEISGDSEMTSSRTALLTDKMLDMDKPVTKDCGEEEGEIISESDGERQYPDPSAKDVDQNIPTYSRASSRKDDEETKTIPVLLGE